MSWRSIDASSRRALVFTPMETRRNVIVDAAIQAEELGYEAVIVPEGWGLDATVVLAEIAQRTERIKLVAGILSVWGRTPATIAMTAATLDDLSDGRFVLGLGASTATLAEGFHGVEFEAPSRRLRRTVGEVRALLNGDRASTDGSTRGLRLGQAPRPDLPIWVAGLGPTSVDIAARSGDGWLPAMLPRDSFADRRDAAAASAQDGAEVISCVMAGVDHEDASGRHRAEQLVGWYLTGMGPFYGDVAAAHGFGEAISAIRSANARPTPGSIEWPGAADGLLEQLAVFGTPEDVRDGLELWDELADLVAVGIGPGPVGEISALIEAAAPRPDHDAMGAAASEVLTAPDGSTSFRAPSPLTAQQFADWCHPRGDGNRRLRESVDAMTSDLSGPQAARTPGSGSGSGELPSRLLGVWAHPDDEAYLSAGLMERVVAAGGEVTVVAITDGEAGFPDDDDRPPAQRAEQRRTELRSAMAVIGVEDVRFLGVADGSVATADADRLVSQIDAIVRDVVPDTIVTFGPDGITGHADHVANSALVTRAWMRSRTGELWYAAKTTEWLAEWRDVHDRFGVWMTGEPTGVRSDDVEVVVDLEGTALVTKRAVLAEHRSQTAGLAVAFGEAAYRRWISEETFRRPTAGELLDSPVAAAAVAS